MRIFLFIILSLTLTQLSATNYKEGDTLRIAAPSGLNLRVAPNAKSDKITLIGHKEEVVVSKTFDFNTKGTIEGWDGNWIEVSYEGQIGFVFDAYLTSLEWPISLLTVKPSTSLSALFSPENINVLAIANFGEPQCEIYYPSTFSGESTENLKFEKFPGGHIVKTMYGWEGYFTELVFNDIRDPEIFYLLKTILDEVRKTHSSLGTLIVDDEGLRMAMNKGERWEGNHLIREDQGCWPQLALERKVNGTISIFFAGSELC